MKKLALILLLPLLMAAAPQPSGTLTGPSTATYGDTVTYDVTTQNVKRGHDLWVQVVCVQGNVVVFQYSDLEAPYEFPLVDQTGLEWDGGAASCFVALRYREKDGRNGSIITLAPDLTLNVAAQPEAFAAAVAAGSIVGPTGDASYGGTITFDATFTAKKNENVRLQVICQSADTSVIYGDVRDLASSPATASFVLGFPEQGTSVWDGSAAECRADLFSVAPNHSVTYLDTVEFHAAA